MFKAQGITGSLNPRKTKPTLSLAMFFLIFTSPAAYSDSVSEYKIKAGFIYNFARFTKWPDNDNELRICIYGKDPFGHHIDHLKSKVVSSRSITIFRTHIIENIKPCHVVFLNINPVDQLTFKKIINSLKGSNTLTISDTKNVINYGVMVGLDIKDDKVSFNINYTSILESELKINPQLIKLAKKVI